MSRELAVDEGPASRVATRRGKRPAEVDVPDIIYPDVWQILLEALQRSDARALHALLKKQDSSFDINGLHDYAEGSDVIQTSLLHIAAANEEIECVKVLIKARADVNCLNSIQGPVLDEVAFNGCVDIAKILVKHGAKKAKRNRSGANALHTACCEGNLEMVKYLVSENIDVNSVDLSGYPPICWAIHVKNEDISLRIMQLLVSHGAHVNKPDNVNNTPLMWAVDHCRPAIVRFLLENKADVYSVNDDGDSPACLIFDPEIVLQKQKDRPGEEVLFEKDPNQARKQEKKEECRKMMFQSLLRHAVEIRALDVVKHCLSARTPASYLKYNPKGDRAEALTTAASEDSTTILSMLLNAKCDVTIPDTEGNMAIHCAADHGNSSAIKLLLEAKCSPDLASLKQGWTALMFVCEISDEKHGDVAAHMLLEARANVNLQDNAGNTALIWAVFKGSVNCVKLLLAQPSLDLELANKYGCRASHYAVYKAHLSEKHFQCFELLLPRINRDALNKMGYRPADLHASITHTDDHSSKVRLEKKEAKKYSDLPSRVYNMLVTGGHMSESTLEPAAPVQVFRCADMSGGLEPTPIPLVNEVDGETKLDWKYITSNVASKGVNLPTLSAEGSCCNCEGECSVATNCPCLQRYVDAGQGYPFTQNQLVRDDVSVLYECSELCSCKPTCCNRLVQHGVQVKFEVFRAKWKGWGVRALEKIVKGRMIVEYIGEIIHEDEVERRTQMNHSKGINFVWSFGRESEFSIDPLKFGNVARMVNHSCNPNLAKKKVYVHHRNQSFPSVAFFSSRDIEIGEELSVDYGWIPDTQAPNTCMPCRCGASDCRRLLS